MGIVKGCILREEEKLLVADYGVRTGDKLFVVKPKEKPRKRKHNEISASHRLVKVASGILTYESTDSSVDQVSSSFFSINLSPKVCKQLSEALTIAGTRKENADSWEMVSCLFVFLH